MQRTFLYLLLALACALLQACGSSNSIPAPPPTPPQPQITIAAPLDGSTVTTLPTMLQVTFTNGADPSTMKAQLDGVDITAQFAAADSTGSRHVQVDRPLLNLGKNQLQVFAGTLRASASFTVALNGLGSTASAELPLLIPIQTRYLTGDGSHNSDYNIALFADPNHPGTPTTLIPAPNAAGQQPGNQGLQIVFLRRSDLAPISNVLVPNEVPASDGNYSNSALYQTLAFGPPAGCGTVGCLLIMQSLGTLGYTPCSVTQYPVDCGGLTSVFEGLGASAKFLYANGAVSQVGYSFIGNSNSSNPNAPPPGAYFERLTCSGSNSTSNPRFCDSLPLPGISSTAPSNATPSQIGNMAGALVRDNYLNFTYVQNAPTVAFSSAIDNTNQGQNFPSHAFTINGQTYWSGFPTAAPFGGFHVVILDRTTLALKQNQWWAAQSDASELIAISNFFSAYNTDGNLVFFAAFGDTTYTANSVNRAVWSVFAGGTPNPNAIPPNTVLPPFSIIPVLGGTPQVFYLVNNQEHFAQVGLRIDDYTLVGGFAESNVTGLAGQNVSAEMSSVISRETEAFPQPSLMEGFLKVDHQGYYSPSATTHRFGMATEGIADAVNASRLNPIPWPFPGPDPTKSQAAYTWISQQLCCDDVRAAYINQSVLPALWLDELAQLSFNATSLPASDQTDFDAMKAQLTSEFQYLAAVRQLQINVRQVYQDQQSNVALELQQAQDQVISSAQVTLTVPAQSASWLGILGDVFGVVGSVSGFIPAEAAPGVGPAIATACSLATLATQVAANETTTAGGSAIEAEEAVETTAGGIAAKTADEYARTLVQLGNQFDRVATDWGRLKTLGAPLLANQLPWDANASGLLLQTYNRVILRQFYARLLPAVAQVNYYPYTSDQAYADDTFAGNQVCQYEDGSTPVDPYWHDPGVPVLLYPTLVPNTDTNDGRDQNYPFEYQWATWGMLFNQNTSQSCALTGGPDTKSFGLFAPIDPANLNSLGAYRIWFFTRNGFITNPYTGVTPCFDDQSGICTN